jgi:predicted alpha/beta hydrolase
MTATATYRRSGPSLGAALKRVPGEALVFAAATILALVHALDDAILHRQPGVPADRHALALGLALSLGTAAIALFGRMRAGLRAGVALAFGGLATTNGALHLIHVLDHDTSGSDVTGVLAFAAGVVLVGLSAAIVWRHRGSSNWRARTVAVPATLVALALALVPGGVAIVEVHKWRESVGTPPSAAYRDVTFRTTDGLKLAGWYRPSTNGASIIVAHGGGSDRRGAVAHASMLARHGYGVLLYDARGRGESEGDPNSYAWGWEKDANGAVAFLKRQPDVRRIGGLGLSSGADTLVDVAATNPDLRATIGDGTALRTFEDAKRLGKGTVVEGAAGWVMFKAVEVLSGQAPPVALEDRIARITSPLLLISSGRDAEYEFNALYMKSAQPTTQHWNMPDGHHTRGLREYPAEYERRVVEFFAQSL